MDSTSPVFMQPDLADRFEAALVRRRVIFFSAPCGCGKTTVARHLLRKRVADIRSCEDASFLDRPVDSHTHVLLIDDLQLLTDTADRYELSDMTRDHDDMRFVFLSRGAVPGWLMPFSLSGLLETFTVDDLLLDREGSRQMLESCGVSLSETDLIDMYDEINGYPIALRILGQILATGRPYGSKAIESTKLGLFRYMDETVYRRFEKPLRNLLLSLAPFETFTLEMAKLVSGDENAERLADWLNENTTMCLPDGLDGYRIYPIFRQFLLWESSREYSLDDERALYIRAGLFYETHDDIGRALDCYSLGGDTRKVSELLERHATLHPGVGHYYDTERFYKALPEEEILRSSQLMCGMSMLCALTLDFEQSEFWYGELRESMNGLSRNDPEYRSAREKLVYLDIALPQRGSTKVLDLISALFLAYSRGEMRLPAFSVTSMLPSIMNGGKDFCDWSRHDDFLYATMRGPVEAVLGHDGVGLADCAICESRFEKGDDISVRLLNLMSRLGEIQGNGTPDIEFALVGLLARDQVALGRAQIARDTVMNLRDRFLESDLDRFLPNIDAMLCRIDLRLNDETKVAAWRRDEAPEDILHLRAMWRYRYLTLAMTDLAEGDPEHALLVLAPLVPYCRTCKRTMDAIHLQLLMAICHYRMGDRTWRDELDTALDSASAYHFVRPISQYGAALLPLMQACEWTGDADFLKLLTAETRTQAVNYPHFLKETAVLIDPLSETELQVLKLLCHDLSNQQIGEMLGIKLSTVKTHVSHILRKLSVSRRAEAKAAAEKLHLV